MNGVMVTRAAFVMFAILASAGQLEAQELAATFDQLRVLVKAGDRIRVVDTSGQETRGTIADIGAASLTLEFDRTRRAFTEPDISTIHQRRSDSLANGALWGFGIGAGLGLFGGIALAGADGSSAAIIPVITFMYAGLGAGIGAGLDAMVSAERVIYARRTTASVRLIPILNQHRAIGLAVSLSR